MRDHQRLETVVEALLADATYAGHPLRQALADLYTEFQEQLHQIERITRIADHYYSATREANLSLTERYRKQLRQLEKIVRISDHYQLMLRDLNTALKEASTKDALTGIGNRRMTMDSLKAETARAERLHRPLTLALADIDHFKSINDTYGHDAGDKVLIEIAHVIAAHIRDYDVCGRWGGEEFLIIMPEVSVPNGALIVERLRTTICELNICLGEQSIKLSASFGIAEYRPGESISETIKRADAALFAAKRAGRNRCEIAS
jgi:diguanylate cyclase (GGDEF)-like protein